MRDPRTDPYTEDEIATGRAAEFGPVPSRVLARSEPCADPARCDIHGHEPAAGPRYTPPAPPPLELVVEPAKWRAMTRPERRALIREHRKVGGR